MGKVDQEKKEYLLSILEKLEYGSLLITIHEGVITQLDIHEKTRLVKKNPQNKK